MRKMLLPIFAALITAAITASLATGGGGGGGGNNDRDDRDKYAIGLWGDLPYSTIQATTGVPNLIADMNSRSLAFTAHDGDLKDGSSEPSATTPSTPRRSPTSTR